MAIARKLQPHKTAEAYERIRSIDGEHPLKDRVPGAYVEYRARTRKNGRVLYFNFALAKEMGLITADHEHKMTPSLEKALLDTFAIQIINEYDIINNVKIPEDDIKANMYMATRYLQLQHPNKTGTTSGDGRSIWNGSFSHRGVTWDISSCGTGATCLSPATAINNKFYRTGDPEVSYGCGFSEVSEGLGNAMFSEIFYRNGIKTERTLLVIEFPRGLAINVRAAKNLLRPSHFFNHLKQENYSRAKNAVDFFIDRQIANGEMTAPKQGRERYQKLLEHVATTFAHISAKFENEYIFCWLDWDGDNILCDGGIIDYGSIRQFGLFHHEYRFDDVERWSTTLTEQKKKARYTIQTFAQLVDYIVTGKKKAVKRFKNHAILTYFDKAFLREKRKLMLLKIGFEEEAVEALIEQNLSLVKTFETHFTYFEKATSSAGPVKLEDGISRNAIFCMRDALRELPKLYSTSETLIGAKQFIEIIKSSYANRNDLRVTPRKAYHTRHLQLAYQRLVGQVAKLKKEDPLDTMRRLAARSSITNRYERITGDAMIHVAAKLVKNRKKVPQHQLQHLMESFIEEQVLVPGKRKPKLHIVGNQRSFKHKMLQSFQRLVRNYREGL